MVHRIEAIFRSLSESLVWRKLGSNMQSFAVFVEFRAADQPSLNTELDGSRFATTPPPTTSTDRSALPCQPLRTNPPSYLTSIPSMRPPLRIAVLECDTPVQGAYLKYGGYGNIFRALLEAGADALNQPELISSKHGLQVGAWDVVSKTEYPRLEDVDALLLTGSRKSLSAAAPAAPRLAPVLVPPLALLLRQL